MKDYLRIYLDAIEEKLEFILETQKEAIKACAEVIAEKIREDGIIYVFGSGGHSNMMAEEMFHRAGGFACISPVFVDSIRIPHIPMGERNPGIVPYIFDFYQMGEGDVLLLVNGYGINPVTIETVLEAKKRGVTILAVTSKEYAEILPKDFPGRHSSGLNLHEIVDHVVLTGVPYGDGLLKIDGVSSLIGPYSTFGNAFVCNSIVIKVCELLVEQGIEPPIINSINTIGGLEKNKVLYKKYKQRIIYL